MHTLGIIVARQNSKGIPGKNLAPLCGRPLIYWTVKAAKASCLDRLIISTDSPQIAEYVASLGVEVPFMRPPELAQDDTPTIAVLQDAVQRVPGFDAVYTLQPTNPLRTPGDIDGSVRLLDESQADSVIGYSLVSDHHPARMAVVRDDGSYVPFYPDTFRRRQGLTPVYLRNGSVYVTRSEIIASGSITGRVSRAYILPAERCWAVDEPMDLVVCEALMKGSHGNQ